MFGWGADFPDGFGFLHQIVHGSAIKAVGNHNFGQLDLPEVNALLDQAARTTDADSRTHAFATVGPAGDGERVDRAVYARKIATVPRPRRDQRLRQWRVRHVHDYAALGVER